MKILTLKDFKEYFTDFLEYPVTWGEMDSFGHANNIYYLRYFETIIVSH